jgi:hypothetical protein
MNSEITFVKACCQGNIEFCENNWENDGWGFIMALKRGHFGIIKLFQDKKSIYGEKDFILYHASRTNLKVIDTLIENKIFTAEEIKGDLEKFNPNLYLKFVESRD